MTTLVADGTIQLFAPAQIASMLQETGFAMDLTRVVGPIILACAILYAIPATAGNQDSEAYRQRLPREDDESPGTQPAFLRPAGSARYQTGEGGPKATRLGGRQRSRGVST